MSLTVLVPDRAGQGPSGGDRYDAALLERWRGRGRSLQLLAAAGGWPWPTRADEDDLLRRLAETDLADGAEDGDVALVDGLVGGSAPAVVEHCADRGPTVVLVHSLLADGAGAEGDDAAELDRRERQALGAADAVLVTSVWARERLALRHGVLAAVARPGVTPSPVASGSLDEPVLLSLGAVTPLKNHAVLVGALARLRHLPWRLVIVGHAPDPAHQRYLHEQVDRAGLGDRVRWAGALEGHALEHVWAATDLLVHPSRSETWGMAVAEALAHGIPAVVGAGTGAVEVLAGDDEHAGPATVSQTWPGAAVPVQDPEALTVALRDWLTDAGLRERWRRAALTRRDALGSWDDTGAEVDLLLERVCR